MTGGRNVGMYRLQKHCRTTLGLHWQIHKDAAADWREGAGRMEVAIALGTDPITTYAGSMPLPKHIDEFAVAGVLRNDRVDLVRCKTVDLEVPANAEIVIEGYAERGVLAPEGPFGDHTGYYTPTEPFPLLHVTCITHRRDPIYPSIVVGVPPSEDVWLGKATERIFLPAVQMTVPEIVDYDLPFAGRLPQLLHRLDPQALSRPCQEGDARDLGNGAPVPHEGGGGGRRVGRRARLRAGRLAARRERRSGARRAGLARARSTSSTTHPISPASAAR